MPPKAQNHHEPVRRERKDILQEDLVTAMKALDFTRPPSELDAKILPLLQEAFEAGVDKNLKFNDITLFSWFGCNSMIK